MIKPKITHRVKGRHLDHWETLAYYDNGYGGWIILVPGTEQNGGFSSLLEKISHTVVDRTLSGK